MATASIYVRLSREATERNVSLSGMLDDCRALAARTGHEVVGVHVDDGVSGSVRDRPELLAWLDDATSGRADCLITSHTDRLTREGITAAARILDVVQGNPPVRLLTVDGLDSLEGESFEWRFVVAAQVAKGELRRIRSRNQDARERLTRQGRWTGGAVPFGCKVVVRDGGKYLERDEVEGALLAEVAQRLLRGDGVRTVVRWLNISGHRTRRGIEWQRSSLKSTLLSAASREHVFDLATWREVEKRLTPAVKDRRPGGRPVAHLLSGGVAVCGSCGRKMTTSRDVSRGITRYICSSTSGGEICPAIVSIDAPATDAHVERLFLEEYGEGYFWEERVSVVGAADLDGAERAHERAQAALLADLTPENLTALQEARERLAVAQAQPVQRRREMVATGTYGEQWAEADVPGRSILVAQALARPIVVNAGGPTRHKGQRGASVNLERLDIVWKSEVNPAED